MRATQFETEEDLADVAADEALTRRALKLLDSRRELARDPTELEEG